MPSPPDDHAVPLRPTDFHVLLVLASDDLYGYAIQKAIDEESGGTVRPEIGSLYRVLGRLMGMGMVDETDGPQGAPGTHRGRPRRYYRLTARGLSALKADASRMEGALQIVRARLG